MMSRREELLQELARREQLEGAAPIAQPAPSEAMQPIADPMAPPVDVRKKELMAELERREPGFLQRIGQFARGLMKGTGSTMDALGTEVPEAPQLSLGQPSLEQGAPYQPDMTRPIEERRAALEAAMGKTRYEKDTPFAESVPAAVGLRQNLDPVEEDTLGKVLAATGEFLAPTPFPLMGYGNVVKAGAKGLGKAMGKELGMASVLSGAVHGTPRMTEEGTILGGVEDLGKGIAAGVGVSAAPGLYGKIKPVKSPLKGAEKNVAQYLQDSVGKEELRGVHERLIDPPEYVTGYKPTTAEIADNSVLAQLQRAQQGIVGSGVAEHQGRGAAKIAEALEEAALSKEDLRTVQDYVMHKIDDLENGVNQEVKGIGNRLEAPQAGRKVQEGLNEVLKEKKAVRRAETKPLYDEVSKITEELNPAHSKKYLKNTVARGDVEKDLNWAKGMLKPRSKLSAQDIAYRKSYENTLREVEKLGSKQTKEFLENTPKPKSIYPSVVELTKVREAVNARIQKYHRAGQDQQVLMLKKFRDNLDLDLEKIPLYKEATAKYKNLSEPVSEITKNPALKKVVKQENKQFTLSESRVPKVFINSAAGSLDDSRALLQQIKDKPQAIAAMQAYLNDKAAKYIVNPKTGKVDIAKIESFKEKFPGARVLHPRLLYTHLENVKEAQSLFDRYLNQSKSVSSDLYKNEFKEFGGGDPKNIVRNIFRKDSTHEMEKVISSLAEDATGNALEGLRRGTIEHFRDSITNAGAVGNHNALSYDKMRKFMKEHKGALRKVLTEEQLEVVEEVERIISGQNKAATLGVGPGSPTAAHVRNALDLSKSTGRMMSALKYGASRIGMSAPFVRQFFKDYAELRSKKIEEVLNKALLDPAYAAMLLSTPFKSEAEMKGFLNNMKKFSNPRYLSNYTLSEIHKEQEDDKRKVKEKDK